MGRGVLILVIGTIAAVSYLMIDTRKTAQETGEQQAHYEEAVVANEIAQSAFNIGVSQVKRDFEGWRATYLDRAYEGGDYDLEVSGPAEGPVEVTVKGYFGNAQFEIKATLDRLLEAIVEPLVIDVCEVDAQSMGGTFMISGMDTNPPSASGGKPRGPDVHALRTTFESVASTFAGELPADQVYGKEGAGDIVSGLSDIDIHELYDEAIAQSGPMFLQDTVFTGNVVFGSPSNPTVVKAMGDIELKGNVRGYGILVIDGTLKMGGNAVWEGLILVGGGSEEVELKGNAHIYGSLIIRDRADEVIEPLSPSDRGLPGGHFDIDVFDGPNTKQYYHEHQYDDKFDVTYVDLMSEGCGKKSGGGLCFDQLVGGINNDVRVEFFNALSSEGSYTFTADGMTYSGNSQDGFTHTFDPATLTKFVVNFSTLQSMQGTVPKNVQKDPFTRDDAFSVRLFDTTTNEMVYELSVYYHVKKGKGKVGKGKDKGEDEGESEGESEGEVLENACKVKFKINMNAGIYYSTKALMRLAPLLDTIDEAIDVSVISKQAKATDLSGRFTNE